MSHNTTTKSITMILLLLSIVMAIQQIPSLVSTTVYAQDDEDEEDDKDEKQQEDEEEQAEQEQEPETSDEYIKLQEQINATNQEQQQIKNELSNLLLNVSSLAQQQEQTQEQEPQTPIYPNPYLSPPAEPEPVAAAAEEEEEECDCSTATIENNTLIPPPPLEPPPAAAPVVEEEEEQIPITPQDIKFAKATGEITDPSYTNFYHLGNLFDNKVDDNISYWSQFGDSNFMIQFKHPIQDYNVCSVQVYTHNPKDSPFVLSVGSSSKNITGSLDDSIKIITLDKCVQNVNKIKMSFDADQKFTTLSELKLFGVSSEKEKPPPPPPPPPVLEPQQQNNKTKIMIKNSNADISILNSTVAFKFDATSGVRANNYDIITIPRNNIMEGIN